MNQAVTRGRPFAFLASDFSWADFRKPAQRQCREHIRTGQSAEALPYVRPLHVAAKQFREMTKTQVNVYSGDHKRRERMQHEPGQRKRGTPLHLNSSTVANGSADPGRKRLSVNAVGLPGFTSTRT